MWSLTRSPLAHLAWAVPALLVLQSPIRFGSGEGEASAVHPASHVAAASDIEAGRYLTRIASCHDCHTPGFMEHGAAVPEELWLTGVPIGWHGPWGTTYASNLRLFVQETPEDVWLCVLRERKTFPPMVWDAVNSMSDADLLAVHRYIKSLGPAGEKMPARLDPGVAPTTPYILMEPLQPAVQ